MADKEVRMIMFSDSTYDAVNNVLVDHLQLDGISLGNGITLVPLLLFMYSYTYSDPSAFSAIYDDVVSSSIISIVPTEGTLLKIEDNNSLTYIGEDIDLSSYPAGNYLLLNEGLYVHDEIRESVVISDAIAMIDLSITPHVTAGMLIAFQAYNIESWTQVANFRFDQWVAFGGESDYDKYEEAMLFAAAQSIAFWENL
jgi:hypothetical protein